MGVGRGGGVMKEEVVVSHRRRWTAANHDWGGVGWLHMVVGWGECLVGIWVKFGIITVF